MKEKKFIILFLVIILLNFCFIFFNKKIFAVTPSELEISITIYPTQTDSSDNGSSILIDLFKIFFSMPNFKTEPINTPCENGLCPSPTLEIIPTNFNPLTINPTPNVLNNNINQNQDNFNYVYYDQCHPDFGNTPLPQGCTLCRAGCGPTTVAMIISSLLNPSFNPERTVEYYKEKGFYVGCEGSFIFHAKEVLNQLGFLTTDYLLFDSYATAELLYKELKNYFNRGWTFFVLADFCEGGCGHYFWVVNIDDQKNVWAYDPYYGRKQLPPFNENQYYPFPKYRYAFGVKKSGYNIKYERN